ncbi:nucleotidyltransferase [Plasmodium brasilianum]|uniref:Nucleotidyltransferase, putative n=2 Tax=Plasmodium (Plasmodium) TaxID=418103 RepID=A0A1D3TF80_PLAMA|nr:nucleotidyltransferase, putative [Plasmodium malariae]KAI4835036.1 nucleotidyltransferase [Plasmodium brasilianum]SCP03612.1 nucleotidyltransferase, putative [Plasmodium malariae]
MEGLLRGRHFNVCLRTPCCIKSNFIQKQEKKKCLFHFLLKRIDSNTYYYNQFKRNDSTNKNVAVYEKSKIIKLNDKQYCLTIAKALTERIYEKKGIRSLILKQKKPNSCYICSRDFSSFEDSMSAKYKKTNKIHLTNDFLNQGNLKKEILDIHKKLTENCFINQKKEEIYFLLRSAIMPNLKGKIYFVGSCENNIWIRNSDIDCCIVVENCEDKNSYLYILKVIKSAINLIYPSLTVNIIKASVPIAKIYKGENNICDISINNTVAIVNTKFVSSICNIDERITIINRIIKYWAKQKNINNRSQGTFSSYALFLLTYFFFQNLAVPLLPLYKSIERVNAASFEINSEYFFLQDDVQMPFYTKTEEIKNNFQNFPINEEDVSKLLYGFFEFYSNDICKNGITLDIYNNQIIENKDMTANIYCPITKKIVNAYSINTWKKMFEKIHSAYNKLKEGHSLNVICNETKDNTPNRKIDLKDHLIRRKKFQNLFMP